MRPECYWCSELPRGYADHPVSGNRYPSCGEHGYQFQSYEHEARLMSEAVHEDEPLADWELELLNGSATRTAQPPRYRVEVIKPLSTFVVGTYSAEQYEGMVPLLRDLINGNHASVKVTQLDVDVVRTTTIETTETIISESFLNS